MTHNLLTAEQLATCLGVKLRTVQSWTQTGQIPAMRLSRKVIRYDLSEVVESAKSRRQMEPVNL